MAEKLLRQVEETNPNTVFIPGFMLGKKKVKPMQNKTSKK